MGYTQWILVQQPDLTFRFVADSRYGNFHAGRAGLPQVTPGEVRIVELILHLEKRFVSEVIFVEHRRFPVLESGLRDPASIDWEMTLVGEIMGAAAGAGPNSARRRWARQQQIVSFRWTPTLDEERAIADAVSRRARQSLLGGRVLEIVGA
jgi:hypothetical protein